MFINCELKIIWNKFVNFLACSLIFRTFALLKVKTEERENATAAEVIITLNSQLSTFNSKAGFGHPM